MACTVSVVKSSVCLSIEALRVALWAAVLPCEGHDRSGLWYNRGTKRAEEPLTLHVLSKYAGRS